MCVSEIKRRELAETFSLIYSNDLFDYLIPNQNHPSISQVLRHMLLSTTFILAHDINHIKCASKKRAFHEINKSKIV